MSRTRDQGWKTPAKNGPIQREHVSSTRGRYDKTRFGWTVGGGLEWMFAANWSAKAEYLCYNLGKARYVQAAALAGTPQQTTRVKFDGHIVRVGLNYHF